VVEVEVDKQFQLFNLNLEDQVDQELLLLEHHQEQI
jgi:hypothetical protein